MAKISKYLKLDKDILLEYIYDDNNLISNKYQILLDSRNRRQSYIAGEGSLIGNILDNQLVKIDDVTQKYAKVDTSYYSFLQLKDYSSGVPTKHDIIKIHLPINWTFGEYYGCYIRVYAFDVNNKITYDLSNFFFNSTDLEQSDSLLNFTSPPLFFQEKLWGKHITIHVPSLSTLSSQLENESPKPNSINYNLTNNAGLSITSPIFIDFHFIRNIQTINNQKTYTLSTPLTVTIPQSPEFERLGLVIKSSNNGDFFEIYGTYNNTISGFNQFITESISTGHRYYVQYNITTYEQNIRGKTITFTQHDNFNETVEYRPIIKYSTTTAIIDVEMRLIDSVDDSYILRRASYGLLQDEVSKYSLNLTKINLVNANKPKIYNIKSSIDTSLVGISNSFGKITQTVNSSRSGRLNPTSSSTSTLLNTQSIQIQEVKVPFPILVDRYNIVCKSDNASFNNTTFYGIGKILVTLYPFDNIFTFRLANGSESSPNFLNMSSYGDIKLSFKSDAKIYEFPLYTETDSIDLSTGLVCFKVPEANFKDIKKLYESGVNVFYITSQVENVKSMIYSGLYKIYDNKSNISVMNNQAINTIDTKVNKDPNLPQPVVVTKYSASSNNDVEKTSNDLTYRNLTATVSKK
jgi:hypothetical protein